MGLLTATHALVLLIVLIPVLGAHVLYSEALHGKRFGRELSAVREEGPVVTLAYDRAGADANDHAADVEMLQRTYEETLNAWCNSDGSRYGAAFAENANYVSFDGSVTRGRKEIAQSHEELFTKWLKGSCLVGAIKEILVHLQEFGCAAGLRRHGF